MASRYDPQVPAERLLTLVPASQEGRHGNPSGPYGRNAWCSDVADALGVSSRNVRRWLSRITSGGTLSLYVADQLCAYHGVPFGSMYPEAV